MIAFIVITSLLMIAMGMVIGVLAILDAMEDREYAKRKAKRFEDETERSPEAE